MDIWGYIVIGYFLIGFILTYIWWKDEYEADYELEKEEEDGVEKSMAVLLLVCLVLFWPLKAVKNYFESFV